MGSRPATSSGEPPARIRFASRRCMWRWFLTFLQPHFGGTALRCMPGRSHSPGRGPGLTESASALRTSDAGLLPGSLCRKRCGRRMLDCCRSRCAGSVADVGCWIVADAAVEGNATTIGAVAVNDAMCFSGTALRMPPVSRGRRANPVLTY